MKYLKSLSLIGISLLLFTACSGDDTPDPVLEEEVITTITVTLTPSAGGTAIIMKSQDLDGDGPNAPVITVSEDLDAGVTYNGSIELLNETENPAEDITEEVEELSNEHQFFFTIGGALDATTTYSNFDNNNNPLGTKFTLTTGAISEGTITFTLRHEPTKPNTGLADAGGETDIAATFNTEIE